MLLATIYIVFDSSDVSIDLYESDSMDGSEALKLFCCSIYTFQFNLYIFGRYSATNVVAVVCGKRRYTTSIGDDLLLIGI